MKFFLFCSYYSFLFQLGFQTSCRHLKDIHFSDTWIAIINCTTRRHCVSVIWGGEYDLGLGIWTEIRWGGKGYGWSVGKTIWMGGHTFWNWGVGLEFKPELVHLRLFTDFILLYFCIWWKHYKDLIKPRGVTSPNVYIFLTWGKNSSVRAYLIICCRVYLQQIQHKVLMLC